MIKNIIFDVGMVLVDFFPVEYLKSLGYTEEENELIADAVYFSDTWSYADRGHFEQEAYIPMFIDNLPKENRTSLAEKVRYVFMNAHKTINVRSYAPVWVKELKEKGYRVYFLSNFPRWIREQRKEELDTFLLQMDGGVFSYEDHMLKPDLEIYEDILKKYDLDPKECLFIDDRPANVQGAEKAGIHGLLFTSPEEVKKQLDELPAL